MPSSTLDDLLEAYCRVSAANKAAFDRFIDVARAFQQHGIGFLVLKGADVISRLYGIRGTRPLSDIDLLVRETDLASIDRLLTGLGCTAQIDGNPSYLSTDRRLSLDLATTLWYLGPQDLDELWSRARIRPFPPVTIRCLESNDLFIHVAAYAVVHRGHLSATFVQDLRLLIEQEPLDWPVIVERARRYDLRMPLFHGLSHLRAAVPSLVIPPDVLHRLSPAGLRERLLRWLLGRLVAGEPLPDVGHVLLLLTRPPAAMIPWVWRTLCPSRTFLSYRYGAAARTAPVRTRVARVLHLSRSASRLSWQILKRLMIRPQAHRS